MGLKFIFLFLSLSQPGLDRNIARMMFFHFFSYFFFQNFLAWVGWNEIRDEFFFPFFSPIPTCLDINIVGMIFFFFYKFFAIFFLNYLGQVRLERNSERIFFSLFLGLSQHDMDRNITGMMFFFLIFLLFSFGIF